MYITLKPALHMHVLLAELQVSNRATASTLLGLERNIVLPFQREVGRVSAQVFVLIFSPIFRVMSIYYTIYFAFVGKCIR